MVFKPGQSGNPAGRPPNPPRPRRDDFPYVSTFGRRIPYGDETAEITLGEQTRTIKLHHAINFGGEYSYRTLFVCPTCSHHCTRLTIYEGRWVCPHCDGLQRSDPAKDSRLESRIKRARKLKDRRRLEQELRLYRIEQRERAIEKWRKSLLRT